MENITNHPIDTNPTQYDNVFRWIRGAHIQTDTNVFSIHHDLFDNDTEQIVSILQTKDGLKIGDVIDRLPYGIIDKTITGIGATTLELRTQSRSSIIVVPTKALAYNKYKSIIAEKGEDYALYVGSPIKDMNRNISPSLIRNFLTSGTGPIKKFLVVADSLGYLIFCLQQNGIDVYNSYFLLIDEIDTMQSDSTYRPKLEAVMDHYFMFDKEHRAVVSATLNSFSNPMMIHEPKSLITWENPPRRSIELVYTNFVDAIAINKIKDILSETDDKILIAYNSLDGIINILEQLDVDKTDCGILCSERSFDKVKDYLEDVDNVIDEDGHLQKRIVFMTCAYFAGIDIADQCHLITITSHLQPFTYLSLGRMAQIAGRCRNGNLSETIIYDIPQNISHTQHDDLNVYKNELLRRADAYANFLNNTIEAAKADETLMPLSNYLFSLIDHIAESKADDNTYTHKIIRANACTKKVVPAYFVIDALLEKWDLAHTLYAEPRHLREELSRTANVSYCEKFLRKEEVDFTTIQNIKEKNTERRESQIEQLKFELREWYTNGREERVFRNLAQKYDKKLQDFAKWFYILSNYIESERLLSDLTECYDNNKKLRNYVNAASFYALPSEHPFKRLVLTKFHYDRIENAANTRGVGVFSTQEKRNKILDVFREYLHTDMRYSKTILIDLFNCFFKNTRSGSNDKITGLNPRNFPPLIAPMPQNQDILEMFLLNEQA